MEEVLPPPVAIPFPKLVNFKLNMVIKITAIYNKIRHFKYDSKSIYFSCIHHVYYMKRIFKTQIMLMVTKAFIENNIEIHEVQMWHINNLICTKLQQRYILILFDKYHLQSLIKLINHPLLGVIKLTWIHENILSSYYFRSLLNCYCYIPLERVTVGCFPTEAFRLHGRLNA